jgi:hypothetical protein
MTGVGRPLGALIVLGVLFAGGWWAAQWRIGVGEPVTATEVRLLLNDFSPDAVAVSEDTPGERSASACMRIACERGRPGRRP